MKFCLLAAPLHPRCTVIFLAQIQLSAFVVYYGIGILRGIVGILVIAGSDRITGGLAMGTMDVISVITILGGYFAMYYLTSRKLNLS